MWSTFTKYRKGGHHDKSEVLNNRRSGDGEQGRVHQKVRSGDGEQGRVYQKVRSGDGEQGRVHQKVRFEGGGQVEDDVMSSRSGHVTGHRRLRGRNIFSTVQHSDVESTVASVVSDNTHLYRRSRSAHTLDNKSTKKYLLKSKGKALDDVSSKMKLIENSLGTDSNNTSKTDLKDINEVIYELEGEIKVKENQISELYTQLNNQNYNRDDNSKIEQKLGLLETQMNAKILQMQNKKAKLFKMKKNQDSLGTFEAAMNFRLELGNDAVTLFYCFLFQEPGVKACHHSTTL